MFCTLTLFRVNVDSLTSFISVISPEKFVEKCNGKLDAVFQGSSMRSWMTEDLERAESELNLTILNRNVSTFIICSLRH